MRLYVDGRGRARRKEYWSFILFRIVFILLIGLVVGCLIYLFGSQAWAQSGGDDPGSDVAGVLVWLGWTLLGLPFVAPGWAVSARRLHDIGMSGWLVLLTLIPYLGGLFMFICALIPSQRGANQYGPYPKPVYGG